MRLGGNGSGAIRTQSRATGARINLQNTVFEKEESTLHDATFHIRLNTRPACLWL